MLTYNDVCSLSDLTQDEVEAIAEHEHIPEICAAELGHYLVHSEDGVPMVKRIILDDIREAERTANHEKAQRLRMALRHFVRTHPEAQRETASAEG
jgi:hypothetical protein